MIEEQKSLLSALETQDIPLPQKRGMLNVLHSQIGYMDQPTYERYKRIAEAMEPTRRQIVATFTTQ